MNLITNMENWNWFSNQQQQMHTLCMLHNIKANRKMRWNTANQLGDLWVNDLLRQHPIEFWPPIRGILTHSMPCHASPFIPYYKLYFDLWTCTRAKRNKTISQDWRLAIYYAHALTRLENHIAKSKSQVNCIHKMKRKYFQNTFSSFCCWYGEEKKHQLFFSATKRVIKSMGKTLSDIEQLLQYFDKYVCLYVPARFVFFVFYSHSMQAKSDLSLKTMKSDVYYVQCR